MDHSERIFRITLTMNGPVLSHATAAGAYGLDAPAARDHHGRLLLAGTLIKGRLLEAWTELHEAVAQPDRAAIQCWLGVGGKKQRARLRFGDFTCVGGATGTRTRIRLDADTGAVKHGALQFVDTPFAAGETATFQGEIRYIPLTEEDAADTERWLRIGLRWMATLGAYRTLGFGRVRDVRLEAVSRTPETRASVAVAGTPRLDFALIPGGAFCIAAIQPVTNLFESTDVIPGGAIKGALAATLREHLGLPPDGPVEPPEETDAGAWRALRTHFSALRVTHAFPGSGHTRTRPVTPPLSLVQIKDAQGVCYLRDVLHLDEAELCTAPDGRAYTPAFAVDWKSHLAVKRHFGWATPRRELRVRTAIDRNRRRAATEQLFAYDSVVPGAGLAWYGHLDLSQVPKAEQDAVAHDVEDLWAYGLRGLGKTKTPATIRPFAPGSISLACATQQRDELEWAIVLQTPAILCDPHMLTDPANPDALRTAYHQVWSALSKGRLRLKNFLARIHLAGGEYLHRQFGGAGAYAPYLLTTAGSAFLLQCTNPEDRAQAEALVDDWEEHGLPLPDWAIERYARNGTPGDHWSNCPYIPENGYGEISVNLDIHRRAELVPLTPREQSKRET